MGVGGPAPKPFAPIVRFLQLKLLLINDCPTFDAPREPFCQIPKAFGGKPPIEFDDELFNIVATVPAHKNRESAMAPIRVCSIPVAHFIENPSYAAAPSPPPLRFPTV